MADAAESPKANTDETESGTNGDSTDQEFDITADMMVHDLDDETTLEEEEQIEEKENFSDELADLEKEGDMPLEDLLAMYGYSDGSDEPPADIPLEDIKPETLPPLISARQMLHVQLHDDGPSEAAEDLEQEIEQPPGLEELPESPIPSPLQQDQSDYAPSPQSNNQSNNVFPENQRITRGLLAAYSYFNLGESSSSDDDDEYNPEEWKKEIQIGGDHQAVVPESMCNDVEYVYEGIDKCLWNPKEITEKDLQLYLNTICQPPGAEGLKRDVKRDDEQVLYMLLQCGYDVSEAIRKRRLQTNPQADMALWSEEECRDFESGLRIYGKDFRQIQQNKVVSRSVGEIVQFYYLWKKTERHDAFACQSRLTKKKYAFHPGITDYMDRFLDENESAASSRASSPHNFAARSRMGNGLMTGQTSSAGGVTGSSASHMAGHSGPSGSHHTTITMMSGLSHPSHNTAREFHGVPHRSPGRPPQLQSCVPTSVIVSSPERVEIAIKRPRLEQDSRPRLMNSISSKPPPLKPIVKVATTSPQAVTRELSYVPGLSPLGPSIHIPQESSHETVHKGPSSDPLAFNRNP